MWPCRHNLVGVTNKEATLPGHEVHISLSWILVHSNRVLISAHGDWYLAGPQLLYQWSGMVWDPLSLKNMQTQQSILSSCKRVGRKTQRSDHLSLRSWLVLTTCLMIPNLQVSAIVLSFMVLSVHPKHVNMIYRTKLFMGCSFHQLHWLCLLQQCILGNK